MKKCALFVIAVLFLISLSGLSGCGKPKENHGLKTDQSVQILTESVGANGGTISIDQKGSIKGMKIEIPGNSFVQATSISIATAEIQDQDLGSLVHPVTPLITVDNGGIYSENTIFVTIPVENAEREILIGMYYDPETKSVEGIPSVYQDQEKIILATNHFSSFFVSSASKDDIDKAGDARTNFEPGTDDFIFTNYGSYVAPRGHCTGQSAGMLWYYKNIKLKGGENLYGLLDNNGGEPTSDFQEDDALLYRFASSVFADTSKNNKLFAEDYSNRAAEMETTLTTYSQNELQYYAMKYAMLTTSRPQQVALYGMDSERKKYGHTVVAYKMEGDKIYIADPNYPGAKDRTITYDGSNFSVYNSGENAAAIAAGGEIGFNEVFWTGEFAVCNEDKIAERWQEVERKDMGNDLFPYPEIEISGGVNQTQKSLVFSVALPPKTGEALHVRLYFNQDKWIDMPGYIYRFQFYGNSIQNTFRTEDILQEGKNTIGFYIYDSDGKWYDFQWIDIFVDSTFKLTADKDMYKKGETATIQITIPGSAEIPDMQFFLDSDPSNILSTGKEFKYQIPSSANGTIRVSCKDPQSGNVRAIDLVVSDEEQEDLEFVSNSRMEYYLDKANRIQGEFRSFYDEAHQQLESVFSYQENLQNGNYVFYYENGMIREEGAYLNGERNGPYRSFYDNGQISVEGTYARGFKDGTQKTWRKNGVLESEATFVNGKTEGEFRNYYDTGELYKITPFVDGKMKGTFTEYNRDGTVKKTVIYE